MGGPGGQSGSAPGRRARHGRLPPDRSPDSLASGAFHRVDQAIPADPIKVSPKSTRAYEWTTDRGAAALNDYARANDPFTKVGKQQIAIEVSSVIRASPDSFRVKWTERHFENGQLSTTERWTAILTIVIQPPRGCGAAQGQPVGNLCECDFVVAGDEPMKWLLR